MPRVNLPAGCYGVKLPTREVNDKPGGSITVTDREARWIAKSSNGKLGIVGSTQALTVGTKQGRWCYPCGRLWQAWSRSCPRCGRGTTAEDEVSSSPHDTQTSSPIT
jgi:hypothetical protein